MPFKDVEMSTTHVLDNPIWHALNSQHARFALGTNLAKRYLPGVGIVGALVDNSEAALHDLRQIVAVGETIVVVKADLPEDFVGWTLQKPFRVDQLVCETRLPLPE